MTKYLITIYVFPCRVCLPPICVQQQLGQPILSFPFFIFGFLFHWKTVAYRKDPSEMFLLVKINETEILTYGLISLRLLY